MDERVLIIDADVAARAAASAVLIGAGVTTVFEAASGEEALDIAAAAAPTIVILDVDLPGMGAAAAARRLRERLGEEVHLVAVAEPAAAAKLGDLVGVGADGYVVKGRPADLVEAVRTGSAGAGMLSAEASKPVLKELQRRVEAEQTRSEELESKVARLRALSVTDWLTGLKNHGYFFDRLSEELERSRRYDRPMAVVLGDLDSFKTVNDDFGHGAGDAVLRSMGEVLRTQIREVDIACRVGGEEFGIIMPETDEAGAVQGAERIRKAVEAHSTPGVGQVTISMGVAVFPDDAQERDKLVEAADRALYQAKSEGKNRTRVGGTPGVRTSRSRIAPGSLVGVMLATLRIRSARLADQAFRVAELAVGTGVELGLRVADLERLRTSGLLHDVGMLALGDRVIHASDKLTPEEMEAVRLHPEYGYLVTTDAVHKDVADAIRSHHERFDGSGYPNALSGSAIPLMGRVLAAADAFDAISIGRPHRPGRGGQAAVSELARNSGKQFDPLVVEALVASMMDEDPENVVRLPISGQSSA